MIFGNSFWKKFWGDFSYAVNSYGISYLSATLRWEEIIVTKRNLRTYNQLSTQSDLPRSIVSSIINCTYPSMELRIIHELCQGLEIGVNAFFQSPLFDEENLEP